MAPWEFPGWSDLARAAARGLGWLTALAAIVVLGFIVQCWPQHGGATAPGLIAAVSALLTDSWQALALGDRRAGFPPLTLGRSTVHDTCILAVALGGVAMVMPSKADCSDEAVGATSPDPARRPFSRDVFRAAVWALSITRQGGPRALTAIDVSLLLCLRPASLPSRVPSHPRGHLLVLYGALNLSLCPQHMARPLHRLRVLPVLPLAPNKRRSLALAGECGMTTAPNVRQCGCSSGPLPRDPGSVPSRCWRHRLVSQKLHTPWGCWGMGSACFFFFGGVRLSLFCWVHSGQGRVSLEHAIMVMIPLA